MKKEETYVPRITQLDSNEYDREIHKLLETKILEIGKYLEPGFFNNVKPEINILIKLIAFRYSLLRSNSSFGQRLLNLQYNAKLSGRRAFLFSLLNFLIPYIKDKYDDVSLKWKNEHVKIVVDKMEFIVKVCQLLNLIVFLRDGVYPNLTDRLLSIKIVPQSRLNGNVGYGFMTRELIWHGFMELFKFVLPLINYQYLKKKVYRMFASKPNQSIIQKLVNYNSKTVCTICRELPVYPCRVSLYCEHIACYYCIKSNALFDPEYTCSECGVKNTVDMLLNTLYIQ